MSNCVFDTSRLLNQRPALNVHRCALTEPRSEGAIFKQPIQRLLNSVHVAGGNDETRTTFNQIRCATNLVADNYGAT
jgi:hypothetical protein